MTALNLTGRALWIDFRGVPKNWDTFYTAARKAGVRGAIRYIDAGSEGKQIHAAERQAAARNGIEILLVDELGTGDAWDAADDYAAGYARGKGALADAAREGFGPVGIAAAADAHATARQIGDATRYAAGFASVVGKARAGFYGFREVLTAVRAARVVSWYWLCGSMPSAEDARWIAFWQDNRGTFVINGVECDKNWRLDGPLPEAEEDDMQLDDRIAPVKLADGKVHDDLTVGDVLQGLAQYIAGQSKATAGKNTAHPAGQYVGRIVSIADIKAAVGGVVSTLAEALADKSGGSLTADEVEQKAYDGAMRALNDGTVHVDIDVSGAQDDQEGATA